MKKNSNVGENSPKKDQKPEYYKHNFTLINKKFNEEYEKYYNYVKTNKDEAFRVFNSLSEIISTIRFDNIITELTPYNAIKFKLVFDKNKMLTITKPIDNTGGLGELDVLFNLFEDEKLLASNSINIKDLVNGVVEFYKL